MISSESRFVLGSQSPRRAALLSLLIPSECIEIISPDGSKEAGFEGCQGHDQIMRQLQYVARLKNESLSSHLSETSHPYLLTADTIVIGHPTSHEPQVLGKPDGPDWQSRVRHWFETYYFDQIHHVCTAVCLTRFDGQRAEFVETTEVRFRHVPEETLAWYLGTGESLGKAGGYGLQERASLFVESVSGSLSNVIGLPLEKTLQAFQAWEILR